MYDNCVFTVAGSGPDIWNTADGFHFVYQQWTGNTEIIAHVASFDYGKVHLSRAGVQFRKSLDPQAKNIGLSLELDTLDRYVALLHYRTIPGDSAIVDGDTNPPASLPAPVWIRLIRVGATFTGMSSLDGVAWDTIATGTVTMNATVFVGMAVTSRDSTRLSTAKFDSISIH